MRYQTFLADNLNAWYTFIYAELIDLRGIKY